MLNQKGVVMSVESTLQLAGNALEDVRKRLERARADADDDYEIRQAMQHLDDASEYLRKAVKEIRQQG